MRLQRSLSGRWGFRLDSDGTLQCQMLHPDRLITVPMPWQVEFPELRQYSGYAWYQRQFVLDENWLRGELLLTFGAVDYWCQVYLNDVCVGEHEGGYTPFTFPIRKFVHAGENTLTVRVYDAVQGEITVPRWRENPPPESTQPPFKPELIPHGKQTWYIDASGIWQDVTLTAVSSCYLERIHITPRNTGDVEVFIQVNDTGETGVLQVTIYDHTVETPLTDRQTVVKVHMAQPALWTPDMPRLYTAKVSLKTEQSEDSLAVRFGFREITTHEGKLLLNGQPLYLLCALDQDMYPDTIYTVPSDEFLRDQFIKAKQLGFNSLRCHIKPPDPRYLELADEMGLLIWEEIPSWRTFYPKTTVHPSALYLDDQVKERIRQTLVEIIERDYNHPSLIIWTVVNEDWGTALLLRADDRMWVAEMVDFCKQLDPMRLVVDNSPCPAPWGLSIHVKSDLDDFHLYSNIPDKAEDFEEFIEQFGNRPLWTYSGEGDAQRTGHEPLILSEFGNWAMPSLKPYADKEPDWFELGGWWSSWEGEPGYPMGVRHRFQLLGLNTLWNDYEAFARATQWHAYRALKFEIEAMRRQAAIQGYVVTELSDIYWESNGLLDFVRGTKVFHDRLREINALDVIVPSLDRYVFWQDETAVVRLYVSHYSPDGWAEVKVRALAAHQEIFATTVKNLAQGEVREIGTAAWTFPEQESARTATLTLNIETLAQNEVEVLVLSVSARQAAYTGQIAVLMKPEKSGQPSAFESEMQRLGYQTSPILNENTPVLITDFPTAKMLNWVRAGGDMLFLSSTYAGSPFFWKQGRGGAYSGNWITSFSWLRPEVFTRLLVSNPLTLPFIGIMPEDVLVGLPMEDASIQQDILAGQVSGWLRHPAAHTVQFRYGGGRVIMTTYRIPETIAYHPIAAAMLHDLVDQLAICQPVLKANY